MPFMCLGTRQIHIPTYVLLNYILWRCSVIICPSAVCTNVFFRELRKGNKWDTIMGSTLKKHSTRSQSKVSKTDEDYVESIDEKVFAFFV